MKKRLAIWSIVLSLMSTPLLYIIYYAKFRPWFVQREVLGHSLVSLTHLPFDLLIIEYHRAWTYSLTPDQRADVEKHCLKPEHFVGREREDIERDLESRRCTIVAPIVKDGRYISIEIVGDHLIVSESYRNVTN